MASEYRMTHRVEWVDTDMAGIIHFSSYFRYMEVTEHAFFRSLGLSIDMMKEHRVGWPRVHVDCDYKAPLRFEDEVEVHLRVREKKEKSLTYEFVFGKAGTEVARGTMTTVCVTRDSEGKMKAAPIPDAVAGRIEIWKGDGA